MCLILGINDMKFEVTITGFKTKAQAEEFIKWYKEQSRCDEQWYQNNENQVLAEVPVKNINTEKTFPIIWNGNTAKMILQTE